MSRTRVLLLTTIVIATCAVVACSDLREASGVLGILPTRSPVATAALRVQQPVPTVMRPPTMSPVPSRQPRATRVVSSPTPLSQAQPTAAAPAASSRTSETSAVAGAFVTVGSETANIRSGPGLGYPVIGKARKGEQLAVTGRLAGGGWWQVSLAGKPAWMAASVVAASEDAAKAPVVAQVPAAPTALAATAPQAGPKPAAAAGSGHIAFAIGRGDTSDVALLDAATGAISVVTPNGRQPDLGQGELVVFKGAGGGRDNLFTVWRDGSHLTEISGHGEDRYPQWAPRKLAIAYFSSSAGQDRIYVQWDTTQVPADDTSLRVDIHGGPLPIYGRYPVWLDDKRIAYSGCDIWARSGDCGIWTIDSDSWDNFRPYRLNTDLNARASDSFGDTLLYSSAASGNWEIYATSWALPSQPGAPMPAPRNLTRDAAQDVGATFSPDGKQLAFISNRGGTWGIWVANSDGSRPRLLAPVPEGFGPHWDEERLSWGR